MNTKLVACCCFGIGIAIGIWVIFAGGYISIGLLPDVEKAKELQPFFTGLIAPLFTLGTALLLIANLRTTTEQNFSTNFFKLIDLHNKLVENINTTVENISSEDKRSTGRSFFDDLAQRIANDYNCTISSDDSSQSNLPIPSDLKKLIVDASGKELLKIIYDYYFQINQSDLSHYFENFCNIVRFAESSKVSKQLRKEHIEILRSQLSNYEILVLSYNGINNNDGELYQLIEKYELLKNLNTEQNLSTLRIKRIIDLKVIIKEYPSFRKILLKKGILPEEFFAS